MGHVLGVKPGNVIGGGLVTSPQTATGFTSVAGYHYLVDMGASATDFATTLPVAAAEAVVAYTVYNNTSAVGRLKVTADSGHKIWVDGVDYDGVTILPCNSWANFHWDATKSRWVVDSPSTFVSGTFAGNLAVTGTLSVSGVTTFSGAISAASFSGPGSIPIGSVIATFPNLTGAYSCTATTAADAQGLVKCGGQTLSDATSPMNGQSIPNINDSKFIMGSTTAGNASGAASTTLSSSHIPGHSHTITHDHGEHSHSITDISHTHSIVSTDDKTVSFQGVNVGSSYSALVHNYSGTGIKSQSSNSGITATNNSASISHTGSSGNYGTASPTAVPTIPPYISALYVMRVK